MNPRLLPAAEVLAVIRRRRITVLEQEVARLRSELAAANAAIDTLIEGGLAEDRAADQLIDNLVGQVETLQRDCDDADAFIDKAGDEFSSVLRESFAKDEHINALQQALLRSHPTRRQ